MELVPNEFNRVFSPKDLIAPPDYVAHWDESVTEEQYHADRTSVGSTQLRKVLDSPMGFWAGYYGDQEPVEEEDEADHFKVGKMVHMAILENERFKKTYVIQPKFWGFTQKGEKTDNLNCKEVKEQIAAWSAALPPEAKVCTSDQLDMITGIAEAIMKHPQGPNLIKDCKPEVPGYYRDPETGILCRIKPDLLKFNGSAMTDLKTAKSSDETFFGSQAFNHRYDIQLFMYAEGARLINGVMPELLTSLVIEKPKPHEPAIFYWQKEDLVQAEIDYRAGLRKLRKCIDENKWPYRQEMIGRIRTPQWFIYQTVNKGIA
jgi:hypothetical protein